jgi:coenzyme F420-reducing hydrogenase delta subunit/Pyruvate/2-oxoacid:ferredoxin oxidoreductase delta subunit
LQADNIWLPSVESNRKGNFLAGSCRTDQDVEESLEDAVNAAGMADALLRERRLRTAVTGPTIDPGKCVLCLTCYRNCPHQAIGVTADGEAPVVHYPSCRACGLCAAECPATAIQLFGYTDDLFHEDLAAPGELAVFACEKSGWPAARTAGAQRLAYNPRIVLHRVPCAGKVDVRHILAALQNEARGVLIVGCYEEGCQSLDGATRAKARLRMLRGQLKDVGVNPNRVAMAHVAAHESARFVRAVEGMLEELEGERR